MGGFIGQLAGIMMILLIIVLLVYFLSDLGIVKYDGKKMNLMMPALTSLAVAFVYILAGGIIYNFSYELVNIFQLDSIWAFAPFNDGLESFSLYNIIVKLFARILFDKTMECGMYISLLCGVITGVSTYVRYKKMFGEDGDRIFALFLCMPGMMFAFLPSTLAMYTMFASLTLLMGTMDKKFLSILFAVLATLVHISGIALIIVSAVNIIFKSEGEKRIWVEGVIVIVLQIFIAMFMAFGEIGCEPEYWFVVIPVLVPVIGTLPIIKKHGYYMGLVILISLFSGFYFVDKMITLGM